MRGRRTSVPEELRTGPFTVDEARRHGVTLDHLRDRRLFQHLLRGVYADASLARTQQLWVQAAAKVLPTGAVFSHHTAAGLWEVPVPDDGLLHATLPRSRTCPRFRHIRVHQTHEELPWVWRHGQRVTPPERTFGDLAVELSLVDLVIAGDRMLLDGLTDADALAHQVESAARRRGTRIARSAVSLVRPGARSVAETRLRLLLVLAGLPGPVVGGRLPPGAPDGYAPALHYPRAQLAIEAAEPSPSLAEPLEASGATRVRPLPGATKRWRVLTVDTADLWRTGASALLEAHQILVAAGEPHTPEHLTRTRIRTALDALVEDSEAAWTRVPRRTASEHSLLC